MKRLALLVLLAACNPLSDAVGPSVVAADLRLAGPLVHRLSVELARPAPITVEYWTAAETPLQVRSERAASHALLLTRLRAGTTYSYRIVGTDEVGTFVTEPLPEDLARVGFHATGTPSMPLVLVHLSSTGGFQGYAIVDEDGDVVWYRRTGGFPYGVARRANGNFVLMDGQVGLQEVTPAGEVVAQLAQDLVGREMHHDAIATPANTILFIAFDTRPALGRSLKGEAIWEWRPESGALEKRWSSWDHFSPERDQGPRLGQEWMHANALSIGPRGNVLLSVHYFNQIVSIAAGWQQIEWRFGGINATIPVPSEDRFSGQHTPAEVAPGRILMFDNGLERGGFSRAVLFDLATGEGRKVAEWRAGPDNFAAAVGAARRLPGGNTLVAFGMRDGFQGSVGGTEVYEFAPDGEPVWHLRVTNVSVMFRAEPVESVGNEIN